MKVYLLTLFTLVSFAVQAQNKVSVLPPGTYEVQNTAPFNYGNIVLIDDSHYRLSNENVVGEYKFSATAQRILFISGTLRSAFARITLSGTDPAIVLPLKENEEAGFKLVQADLMALYKKN